MVRYFASLALLVVFMIAGCNQKNPGTWDKPAVEAKIKEVLKLSEISLSGDQSSGYQGTGKNAEGESFKISVTQIPSEKKLTYKSEGDRGSNEDGLVEFK